MSDFNLVRSIPNAKIDLDFNRIDFSSWRTFISKSLAPSLKLKFDVDR